MSALVLLANAKVDSSQRISILAAASPKESILSESSSIDDYVKSVKYEAIASILRQCDRPSGNEDRRNALSSYTAHNTAHRNFNRGRMTREQVYEAKLKSRCKRCNKYGHWYGDHEEDGSLKTNALCSDDPITDTPKQSHECHGSSEHSNNPSNSIKPRGTVRFNMAQLSSSSKIIASTVGLKNKPEYYSINPNDPHSIGPMLDDGAPYSAIGFDELQSLSKYILPNWNGTLDPIPDSISDRPYWQYGVGAHAIPVRAIIGSIIFNVRTSDGSNIELRHLVLDGSYNWVIGRNITRFSNINHMDENTLQVTDANGRTSKIPLLDHDLHSYLPFGIFLQTPIPFNIAETVSNNFNSSSSVDDGNGTNFLSDESYKSNTKNEPDENSAICDMSTKPWKELKRIVDKVHRHVCGHADISDIKLLLSRNNLLTKDTEEYLHFIVSRCSGCRSTANPKSSRKVSISSLNRDFNEFVCVDHLFLDEICIFHAMDAKTRYSAGLVCENTSM